MVEIKELLEKFLRLMTGILQQRKRVAERFIEEVIKLKIPYYNKILEEEELFQRNMKLLKEIAKETRKF
jgi:hypothetical protein